MNILLDTHTLLWTLFNNDSLDEDVKRIIEDRKNKLFVSVVSLWEIEIKHNKRENEMPYCAQQIQDIIDKSDFELLPLSGQDIGNLGLFINQKIHNDPFDHMLMSTALTRQMYLMTHDENIGKYKNVMLISY